MSDAPFASHAEIHALVADVKRDAAGMLGRRAEIIEALYALLNENQRLRYTIADLTGQEMPGSDDDGVGIMFTLGLRLKDRVSGFTGIATAKLEYLNGCTQFCVTPPVDDKGAKVAGEWFDWQQLEIVDNGILMPEPARTGGPALGERMPSATYHG